MFKHLSHILHQEFDVSEDAFKDIRQTCLEQNAMLSEVLVKKKLVTESQLLEAFSRLYQMPFMPKVSVEEFNTEFTQKISIQFLKKYVMVPVKNLAELQTATGHGEVPNDQPADAHRAAILLNDPTVFQPVDDILKILKWDDVSLILSTRESILS